MARIYGLNGTLRGRQGNNVFSVQNGTQVVKAYQPVVANPRTISQQTQRTKFSLAGKISSITPSEALIGLNGGSPRSRRAMYVGQLVRLASVSESNGALVASIPYENVLFSDGTLQQFSTSPTVTAVHSGTETRSRVNVSIPAMTVGVMAVGYPAGYSELCIVALYDAATSNLDAMQCFIRTVKQSSAQPDAITFWQGTRRDCYVVTYVCPFAPMSSNSAFETSDLAGSETAVSLNGSLLSALSNVRWGRTVFVSSIPVIGAQTNLAPSDGDRHVTDGDNGDVMRATKKK